MHLGIKKAHYFLFTLFLCSCQKSIQTGPSVLLVAIEGFSGSNFTCSQYEEVERSGFNILCNEAVRFTHAYTTSPLSQAAMGSILTGELPLYNGLRNNDRSWLPAQTLTLAEKLIPSKAHTFFLVSSPTIRRFSRIHQGFENFNDDYDLNFRNLYRPIFDSFGIFKSWLQSEVGKDTYFSVIQVSDLLFPQVLTQNEMLEPRPAGFDGQLEEIDENLFLLFTYLKHQNLWDKSYIILTGLNGSTGNSRFNEPPGTNLFNENVSIPLFIKPLKGREEIPHQWKVDSHITLHDLGITLEDIFNVKSINHHLGPFKGISLLPLINGKSDPVFNGRPIMIESNWAPKSNPRYSIRDDQWLVVFDKKPLLYNTLTDRNEMNRVSLKDSSYQLNVNYLESLFGESPPSRYEKPEIRISDEFRFTQILIENEGRPIDSYLNEIKSYVENNPKSDLIQWLLIDQLLKQKQWPLIEEFNKLWQDSMVNQVLSLKSGITFNGTKNECLTLLQTQKNNNLKTLDYKNSLNSCTSNDFILLINLLNSSIEKKEMLVERYSLAYKYTNLYLKLIYFDLSKGGIIKSTNLKKLREIMMHKLILGLPKYQKEATQIDKRLNI